MAADYFGSFISLLRAVLCCSSKIGLCTSTLCFSGKAGIASKMTGNF